MNLKKTYPIFADWFEDWRTNKADWPPPGKTRTAAGLLLLWNNNGISTLDEIAEAADMTVNSLKVARTQKVFKVACERAAINFCNYLFCDRGLDQLKGNETELFHTLDALSEESAKVIFEVITHPDTGVDADDKSTADAYLGAREFLVQLVWLTLSRSKKVEMNWRTRQEAARVLDLSLRKLTINQKFYADLRGEGGSVQHPQRSFWKK